MDSEIKSFMRVWSIAITGLIYCHYISSRIPKGIARLISVTPVLYLFITLPLDLHSFHLGGPTTFFLVWLATFKLILFSFDQPPLSPLPNNPFHFISIACLPIKITPKQQNTQNPPQNPRKDLIFTNSGTNPSQDIKNQRDPTSLVDSKASWVIPLPVKVLILGLVIKAYEFRPYLNSQVTLLLYCSHMYLGIELVLALCVLPVRALLGFEIEAQFNEPYLTTSLQDFWGRRWNLMVSAILRPTAYEPMRKLTSPTLGPKWAQATGLVWAFTVSGLVHEAIYYYLTRARPTWEVTSFFVMHGVCTAAEVAAKRLVRDRWRPSRVVSGGLTLGFLVISGNWLFFPQLMRNGVHEKAIKEYAIMVDFCKKVVEFCGWRMS